ncbi:MAG: hypothetical protein ACLPTZ_03455 [Beijerinckiaceae bacterium]
MYFLTGWWLTRCAVPTIMIAIVARLVLAGTYLHCATTRMVIVNAPTGDTSSRSEESLSFVIDDAAKTLTFANGGSLTVTPFDKNWISANRDDIFYEFNRQNGTLSFASSTTKNNVTSTIVGSGRCSEVSTTRRGRDWLRGGREVDEEGPGFWRKSISSSQVGLAGKAPPGPNLSADSRTPQSD